MIKRIEKRGALEFSFTWIFAIIAGAFILFIAFFGVQKFTSSEESVSDAKTAKSIGVLLNPLETSFESQATTLISMPTETRIFNVCELGGSFGKQKISVSQQTYGKFSDTGVNVSFRNKYIFSEEMIQGRSFYVFSKPFEFPFKVADLIYLTPTKESYCFVNPPSESDIMDDLENLNQGNLAVKEIFGDCSAGSLKVCFNDEGGCDILVDYDAKKVEKDSDFLSFEGNALMYAAIFSDKRVYECQVSRLMGRLKELTVLYQEKASFIFTKAGCQSDLRPELGRLSNLADGFEDSQYLYFIGGVANSIDDKNDDEGVCRLW